MADVISLLEDQRSLGSQDGQTTLWSMNCEPPSTKVDFYDKALLEGKMTKVTMISLLIISVLTIVINFGVIIRVIKLVRKGGELKPTFLFIGNLAISDFLIGIYILILFCVELTHTTEWKDSCCGVLTAFVVTACEETICTISLIAIDKYIFICHGMSYRGIVTKKRVRISIAVTWIYSLLIGFLPAMGLHEEDWCACNFTLYINTAFSIILFLVAVMIPLVVILTLYCIILRLAIKVTKSKLASIQSNGVSSVFRLSLKMKSSKSSNSTTSTKFSSSTAISNDYKSSPTKSQRSQRSSLSIKSHNMGKISVTKPNESLKSMPKVISITSSNRNENSSLPTVVELQEFDLMPQELSTDDEDSSVDSDDDINIRKRDQTVIIHKNKTKKGSYDLCSFDKALGNNESNSETSSNNHSNSSEIEESISDSNDSIKTARDDEESHSRASLNSEGEFSTKDMKQKSNLHYFKKIFEETKDKVSFLQKCRAIKPIILILLCFTLTYLPFVTATLAFKVQKDKNKNLFKALNNLLYFSVILNSLINPFVYAYGYKEFRVKTKNFKGLFAKEKRPVL